MTAADLIPLALPLTFAAGLLTGLWLARPSVGARRIAGMRLSREGRW